MDKVLVNVYVPVLNTSYDIFIPQESLLNDVLELVKKAIMELSDGLFFSATNTELCKKDNGEILDINLSVYELGIRNGSKLMLI